MKPNRCRQGNGSRGKDIHRRKVSRTAEQLAAIDQHHLHLRLAEHQQRVMIRSGDYHLLEDDEKTDSGSDQESYQEEDITEFVKNKGKQPSKVPEEEKPFKDPYIDSALDFFTKLKQAFANEPQKIPKFFQILCSLSSDEKYDLHKVLNEVKLLFQGHLSLLPGFNNLLPHAFHIQPHEVLEPLNQSISMEDPTQIKGDLQKEEHKNDVFNEESSSSTKAENIAILKRHKRKNDKEENDNSSRKKLKRPSYVDHSFARVSKYATYDEYRFFDNIREAFKSPSGYDNFLQIINLFNEDLVTRSQLYENFKKSMGSYPELCVAMKRMLRLDKLSYEEVIVHSELQKKEPPSEELISEIDYFTTKSLGASYRMLPKHYPHPTCSGRTELCNEVLNDTYISFPSWSEEPTYSFYTTQKTAFEEKMYRCEDERFELDHAISTSHHTLSHLEELQSKIEKMTNEEKKKYSLDNSLHSSSSVLHFLTIRRLYGDKANDLFQGLKDNPIVAIPLVIKRLRAKLEEWRAAQAKFNGYWKKVIDAYYLRSLDCRGVNFRSTDIMHLRSKSLLNNIYILYDERKQSVHRGTNKSGPHIIMDMGKRREVFEDMASLLIYYVNINNNLNKQDKKAITELLLGLIPQFLGLPTLALESKESDTSPQETSLQHDSGDEESMDDESESKETTSPTEDESQEEVPHNTRSRNRDDALPSKRHQQSKPKFTAAEALEDIKTPVLPSLSFIFNPMDNNEKYRIMYCTSPWYLTLRLLHIFMVRMAELKAKADEMTNTNPSEDHPDGYFRSLLNYVCCMLDGIYDIAIFEDKLRRLLTINAYKAYTLDRVVQNLVRQIQKLVEDPCMEYFRQMEPYFTNTPLSPSLEIYYRKKVKALETPEEKIFRVVSYQGIVTIELLASNLEKTGSIKDVYKYESYKEEFLNMSAPTNMNILKTVLLRRNLKRGQARCRDTNLSPMFHVWDNDEIRIDRQTFHLTFAQGNLFLLYWASSLGAAQKSHRKLSDGKTSKFWEWHRKWIEANVTKEQIHSCNAWFMARGVKCYTVGSPWTPPYFPITKYKRLRQKKQHSHCKRQLS